MDIEKITYALAALAEAGYLISRIAREGELNADGIDNLTRGVLKISSESTMSIYDMRKLRNGLTFWASPESLGKIECQDTLRYVTAALMLEANYRKEPKARSEMAKAIDGIKSELPARSDKSNFVASSLADWYSQNASGKLAKISIHGEEENLKNTTHMTYVRALLAAALRAAYLWRQLGGTNVNFLLNKSKTIACSKRLLSELSR